ncbi:MAG TPA: hypothetical protein VEH04_01260 [Verrucomicrobiae bacterium]|nr:hypothetical protein [Verrucomicrobiae bacterium]
MAVILLAWILFHPKRQAVVARAAFGEVFIVPMTRACKLMIGKRTAENKTRIDAGFLLEQESAPETKVLARAAGAMKLLNPRPDIRLEALSEPLSQTSESVRIAPKPLPFYEGRGRIALPTRGIIRARCRRISDTTGRAILSQAPVSLWATGRLRGLHQLHCQDRAPSAAF